MGGLTALAVMLFTLGVNRAFEGNLPDLVDRTNLGIIFQASSKHLYNTESYASLVLTVGIPEIPELPEGKQWGCPYRGSPQAVFCGKFKPLITALHSEYDYLRKNLQDKNYTLANLFTYKKGPDRKERFVGFLVGLITGGIIG